MSVLSSVNGPDRLDTRSLRSTGPMMPARRTPGLFLAGCLALCTVFDAGARQRTVEATITVLPVETLRLADFDPTDPTAAPQIFTVSILNDAEQRELRAVVRVTGAQAGLLGVISTDISGVMPLQTVMLTNRDFDSYDLGDAAADVIDYATERGELPPDDYQFSLTVTDKTSSRVLAEDSDFTSTSVEGDEVFALSPGVPLDQSPEALDSPQPIFIWQSEGDRFDFSLYEVASPDIAANDIATGLPVFEQADVQSTTYPYPSFAEALRPGVTYAWLVQSVVRTAEGAERIPGEMLWFTYRPGEGGGVGDAQPAGLASIRVSPQEHELPWGGVVQLEVEGLGPGGEPLGVISPEWEVIPQSGGEVTPGGMFTAGSSQGVVAVVAHAGEHSDYSTITVTPTGRATTADSVYVMMMSPSPEQIVAEPSPMFVWQVVGADSSLAQRFRVALDVVDFATGLEPLWQREVVDATELRYPVDEEPLESGSRYAASVALLDSTGVELASTGPVEFALNRDPKISWELYTAWDTARRTATDSVRTTLLVLVGDSGLSQSARDAVVQAGGAIEVAEGPWVQLNVPFASLGELASLTDFRMLTLPSPHVLFHDVERDADYSPGAFSGHVAPLNNGAADRFAAVDVVVLEFGFDREAVEQMLDPSRVRYHSFRADGRIEGAGGADAQHGVATLRAMVEYLPPTANVHLVNYDTEPEFQQALRFAVEEIGARVLTCSVSWANAYDDYDGTSIFSQRVETILGDRSALVVAAGNFALSHWEGTFRDADRDNAHDFSSSASYLELELNSASRYDFLLSWDEWTRPNRDLDLEILDEEGNPLFDRYGRAYASRNMQADAQYVEPLERIRAFRPPMAGVQRYRVRVIAADGNGVAANPPSFELYVYPPPVGANPASQPASSLASGVATTRSRAVIPVGAAGFSHSSHGPTNDGRVRPDFSTDGTVRFGGTQFEGTSFATPRVAAALASVLSRHPDWSLEQALDFLRRHVAPSAADKSNIIGWGTLDLDAVVNSL